MHSGSRRSTRRAPLRRSANGCDLTYSNTYRLDRQPPNGLRLIRGHAIRSDPRGWFRRSFRSGRWHASDGRGVVLLKSSGRPRHGPPHANSRSALLRRSMPAAGISRQFGDRPVCSRREIYMSSIRSPTGPLAGGRRDATQARDRCQGPRDMSPSPVRPHASRSATDTYNSPTFRASYCRAGRRGATPHSREVSRGVSIVITAAVRVAGVVGRLARPSPCVDLVFALRSPGGQSMHCLSRPRAPPGAQLRWERRPQIAGVVNAKCSRPMRARAGGFVLVGRGRGAVAPHVA